MSVHPFQPRRDLDAPLPPISEDDADDDVDDLDEALARFGSVGPANREAHRAINPSVLAAITGYPMFVCQEFHHALFTLLEDAGHFDGLLTTPLVCIGRGDRLDVAQAWRATNPPVVVDEMLDAADPDEADDDVWRRIIAMVDADSLALAEVAGSNPSLTFGSIDAIGMHIDHLMGEITLSTLPEQVVTLTRVAFDLLARLPGTIALPGGAARATCLTRDTFTGWQR